MITQTYEKIEILLIDDGSTDSSGVICDKFQNNIKVRVFHMENKGVSNARNVGIKEAQGSLLVFVDSDDWVDADYIEILVDGIEKYEADIYMCSYYDETREKSVLMNFFQKQHYVFENENIYELINDNMLWKYCIHNPLSITDSGVPWGKIYKKEYIEKYEIFFPYGLKRMQDTIFNLYAFYHAKRIAYDNIPKYHYRRSLDSAVHRYTEDFDMTSIKVLEEIRKFYELYFINEKWESVYYTRAISFLILYVNLFLGHEKCKLKFREKIERLEELSRRLYGEEASDKRIIGFNRKYRLIQWLIKRKQYEILYLILYVNARIKKRKKDLYE